MRPNASLLIAALLLLALPAPAAAQTGPQLLLRPFRQSDQLELDGSALFGFGTETDNQDAAGDAFYYRADVYDLAGRVRLTHGLDERGIARAQPRAGFQTRYVQIHSGDPALPDELFDGSVALGMGILAYEGWLGGISVGLGHAGVDFERDANGLYVQADFAVGKTFENGDALGFVIDYNGNRSFLPDWPLPGLQYRKRLDRPRPRPRPAPGEPEQEFEGYDPEADPARLVLAVGFPYAGVQWRPDDRFRAELTFSLPDNLNVRADYTLVGDPETSGLGIYASLSRTVSAHHWNELSQGHDRLIFRQSLAEAGVQWRLHDRLELVLGGGWAFDQEYDVGFDTRDTDSVADVDPTPYLRGQLRWRL